jgi:D-alanyl-D-alanine carboxypeptidase
MLNEKRIKALIIISLLLIESFVWVVNGPKNFWSLGFLGGDGGHTSVEQQPGGNPDDGKAPGEPAENPDRELALQDAKDRRLLILVNKEHPVDENYKPDDLAKINDYAPDRAESTRYMRAEAANAFGMLVDKAAEDGVVIKMTTAYRSYDFQMILFDSYVEKEGEEKANTFSAKPGQSEHQTGLAVDVSSPSVDYQLSDDYGKTEEGKWLADHAYRFGFILRFPKGKEDITGYQYEPWHLRYVGLTAAKEIRDQGISLEEYLQETNME